MSYSESTWRNRAAPIIRQIIAECAGQPERIVRARLREAYPFGERKYHPYKIWIDEVQRQLGHKPLITEHRAKRRGTLRISTEADPRQMTLGS